MNNYLVRIRLISLTAIAAACLLAGSEAAAQLPSRAGEALRQITENPDRAATNMHSYEFRPVVDTRAPKGYKAVYISHYGRHGSRYEQSASFSKTALQGLRKADSLSLLTSAGQTLLRQVQASTDEHDGMEGILTPRGGREHQLLARRMASRFPTVFRQKDRREVSAFSSTVQRCLLSMAYFTGALEARSPQLQFTYTSGARYMRLLSPSLKYSREMFSAMGQGNVQTYDWDRLFSVLFTRPEAVNAFIPDREPFVRSIYSAGGLCQDLDFLGIDIFRTYFTPEELTHLWKRQNDLVYGMWANSLENGDAVRDALKPLLADFVEKADAALSDDSHRCADLRFGHDTGVLPLAALLGIDDPNGNRFSVAEAHDHWFSYERIPMATNLQMIFYRNKKGEVLTKVLYNEEEVCFPGLSSVEGPYYKWETLRTWFLKLCR